MAKLTAQYKLNEEQLRQLKQIVPEAFNDNTLDFNSLYEALSDYSGDDEDDIEQFGLFWHGKRKAKRAAAIPPVGTLAPFPGGGVDEETTRNIYIEGDNLEVLKVIKKAYAGRIKMIYIDPPYNTGNDFVYNDDFSESLESYQRRVGQIDEAGNRMTTNTKSDGRFHSNWCSMIYPRLRLARELLSEDGVIFISIDDHEVAHLRKICDEIYGEENFVSDFIRKTKSMTGDEGAGVNIQHENVICFCKNKSNVLLRGEEKSFDAYKNPDDDPNGEWTSGDPSAKSGGDSTYFPIKNPFTGKEDFPPRGRFWAFSTKTRDDYIAKGKIKFKTEYRDGERGFIFKRYKSELSTNFNPVNSLDLTGNDYMNSVGTKEIYDLFGGNYFDNPKPSSMIKKILSTCSDKDFIVLDFFSGSATTAHALMKLNAEDGGKRQYIMVQLPETCAEKGEAFKNNFRSIPEIGKERIRRAGKKIKKEAGSIADNIDIGFKVFRFAPSNYKAWENYKETDIKQLEELFKEDSLKPGWKEEDILVEIMLLEGFPLDSKIEQLPQFKKNKVMKVGSGFCEHALYICLDRDIQNETVETLKLADKDRFICLDSAVDDQSKIRLEDKNLIKTL